MATRSRDHIVAGSPHFESQMYQMKLKNDLILIYKLAAKATNTWCFDGHVLREKNDSGSNLATSGEPTQE